MTVKLILIIYYIIFLYISVKDTFTSLWMLFHKVQMKLIL